MLTTINEIQAKSILSPTKIPGTDFVINPYNGCQFACTYCYAAQIARWKHPHEEWGTYLDVKINAPELLRQELQKLERKHHSKNFGNIWFSSVTDPYTGLEGKYYLTRQCLQVLIDFGYQGVVSLQSKSPLITRDIDLFNKLAHTSIGMTITSLDDQVSRFLEVQAPPVSSRISALKQLHQAGIPTYAFIGPIFPGFMTNADEINPLLDKLEEVGISEVWFEHINLNPKIKARLFEYLKQNSPDLIPQFQQSDSALYRQNLDKIIHSCLEGRNLKLGLGKVIYHSDLPKKV